MRHLAIDATASASWAGAAGKPAEREGGKCAQGHPRDGPRHPNLPQSDDQADASKRIQRAHRIFLRRNPALTRGMLSFSRIVQGWIGILRGVESACTHIAR